MRYSGTKHSISRYAFSRGGSTMASPVASLSGVCVWTTPSRHPCWRRSVPARSKPPGRGSSHVLLSQAIEAPGSVARATGHCQASKLCGRPYRVRPGCYPSNQAARQYPDRGFSPAHAGGRTQNEAIPVRGACPARSLGSQPIQNLFRVARHHLRNPKSLESLFRREDGQRSGRERPGQGASRGRRPSFGKEVALPSITKPAAFQRSRLTGDPNST